MGEGRRIGLSTPLATSQITPGSLTALRGHFVLRRGQGLTPPFPAPLSPLVASFLRFAPDRFRLTIPISFWQYRSASVASLRRLIGFLPES